MIIPCPGLQLHLLPVLITKKLEMGALGVTITGQQLSVAVEHIARAEFLSHHILQQMGRERTLLPETKEGHNHLQSNILLDTVGKICCYRVIPYSFLETVTLKKTPLG